jgi:hydroxymethylbilane synthase
LTKTTLEKKLIIGTRGSDLALWQAHHVQALLTENGFESQLKIIKTQGDRIQDIGFDKMEGKGFFTKELEEHLLNAEIDIAVHSHKDLETNLPEGTMVAAVLERADARDVLISLAHSTDSTGNLKSAPVIGTSSARRKAQAREIWPDADIRDLRGNVPTRIEKLRKGDYDAILLAKAGLDRLGLDLSEFHVRVLETNEMVPAPAQGALAIQTRDNDRFTVEAVSKLNRPEVKRMVDAERLVLNRLEGGCRLPLGVYCTKIIDGFKMNFSFSPLMGGPLLKDEMFGEDPFVMAMLTIDVISQHEQTHRLPDSEA